MLTSFPVVPLVAVAAEALGGFVDRLHAMRQLVQQHADSQHLWMHRDLPFGRARIPPMIGPRRDQTGIGVIATADNDLDRRCIPLPILKPGALYGLPE